MQLVIDAADFRRLSAETQAELTAVLGGRPVEPRRQVPNAQFRWRRPVDLTPDLAVKLIHGLADEHVKRLVLFGTKDGRVAMSDLLRVTKDDDIRVLSHFEGVLTRKLRRLVNDTEKKATLFGWDYDATRWSPDGGRIVDGIYYVTEVTAQTIGATLGRRRGRLAT